MAIKQVTLSFFCMAVCVLAAATPKENIDRSPTAWHNAFHEAVKPILKWFLLLPIALILLMAVPINLIQMRLRKIPGMEDAIRRSEDTRKEVLAQIKIDEEKARKERKAGSLAITEDKIRRL